MDFFGKLNAKNTFGIFENAKGKGNNIVNIICGVLLIILIVIIIICLVKKDDSFSNQNVNHNHDDLSDCDVLMFDREGCGFSARMKKIVEDNNHMVGNMKVCIIDMTKHTELTNKYKVTGTPTFALKDNPNVLSIGFKPLNKVLEDLRPSNGNHSNNSFKNDIVICGRMSCPYCAKAKKKMEELGIDHDFVDSGSPDCVKEMRERKVNGVPLILNNKTGSHIVGYDEKKIEDLKN